MNKPLCVIIGASVPQKAEVGRHPSRDDFVVSIWSWLLSAEEFAACGRALPGMALGFDEAATARLLAAVDVDANGAIGANTCGCCRSGGAGAPHTRISHMRRGPPPPH